MSGARGKERVVGNQSLLEIIIPKIKPAPITARRTLNLMTLLRSIFYLIIPTFLLLVVSPATNAQTAVSYRFLEVLDNTGKPVADAKVEPVPIGTGGTVQTDKSGAVNRFEVYVGDFNTMGLKISKAGYLAFEDRGLFGYPFLTVLYGEIPGYSIDTPLGIVLLKTPSNEENRKDIEARQRGRELIQAIKNPDLAAVQQLLKSGVSPDTTDDYGIAAIVWAAVNGDLPMIKALLTAGADVRDKTRSGSRALLNYLRGHRNYSDGQDHIDYNLVQSLIKAGSDVNAANQHHDSALSVAKGIGFPKLIKLLESAGAREPR